MNIFKKKQGLYICLYTGSLSASSRTLKKRSQLLEKLTSSVSSPVKGSEDMTSQQASTIMRNKQEFIQSAEKAGIQIVSRFTLKRVIPICCNYDNSSDVHSRIPGGTLRLNLSLFLAMTK